MGQYKFICEEKDIFRDKIISTTTKDFEADSLADVLSYFKDFLNGCGYFIENDLVEDNGEVAYLPDVDCEEDVDDDYWDNLSGVVDFSQKVPDELQQKLDEIRVWPYEQGVK